MLSQPPIPVASPTNSHRLHQSCESIADHMFRMSHLTLVAPPSLTSKLDMWRCMKMCLIHDMAEALVGDITPIDNVPKVEKSRREAATMDYLTTRLLGNVHGGIPGKHIRDVWQEYEDSQTPESVFVHDLDKVELLLQMVEYERRAVLRGEPLDLGEFAYVATKVKLDEMKVWAEAILQEREASWAGREHLRGDKVENWVEVPVVRKHQDEYYGDE
jgi:putative hydrolases of HD superfamily